MVISPIILKSYVFLNKFKTEFYFFSLDNLIEFHLTYFYKMVMEKLVLVSLCLLLVFLQYLIFFFYIFNLFVVYFTVLLIELTINKLYFLILPLHILTLSKLIF